MQQSSIHSLEQALWLLVSREKRCQNGFCPLNAKLLIWFVLCNRYFASITVRIIVRSVLTLSREHHCSRRGRGCRCHHHCSHVCNLNIYIYIYCANQLNSRWKSIFSNQIALNLMMLARSKDAHGIFSIFSLFTSLHFVHAPLWLCVCVPSFINIQHSCSLALSLTLLLARFFHLTALFSSISAFNFSGGYFNPVLATALKWGCSGYTNIDHVIVYWIGACAGALLSVPLYKYDVIKKLVGEKSLARLKPKAD